MADSGRSDSTSDDDTSALLWAFHHLAVALAEADVGHSRHLGLTPTDYLALKHLMVADRPLGPAELARRLGMSTGSVNALVDRLQARGHLERRPDVRDRRRIELHVSTSTASAVLVALDPLVSRLADLAAELEPHDRVTITSFLRLAAEAHHLDNGPDPAHPKFNA